MVPADDPKKKVPAFVAQILYNKNLQAFEKVIAITDGRDKVCKLIQYGGRLLVWYLLRFDSVVKNPAAKQALGTAESFFGQLSKLRKIIRLCKWCLELPSTRKLLQDHPKAVTPLDKTLSYINIGNSFLSVSTDLIDDIIWYAGMGLLPKALADYLEPIGSKVWLINVTIDMAFLTYDIYTHSKDMEATQEKMQKLDKNDVDGLKKLEQEVEKQQAKKKKMTIGWFKFLGDSIVAMNSGLDLGWSKGIVQSGGLLSGSCSFYKLFQNALATIK